MTLTRPQELVGAVGAACAGEAHVPWLLCPSFRLMKELLFLHLSFCRADGELGKRELKLLMEAVGHPEDEVELDHLMHEWDISGNGALDFDGFVSLVATFMKKEGPSAAVAKQIASSNKCISCGDFTAGAADRG